MDVQPIATQLKLAAATVRDEVHGSVLVIGCSKVVRHLLQAAAAIEQNDFERTVRIGSAALQLVK